MSVASLPLSQIAVPDPQMIAALKTRVKEQLKETPFADVAEARQERDRLQSVLAEAERRTETHQRDLDRALAHQSQLTQSIDVDKASRDELGKVRQKLASERDQAAEAKGEAEERRDAAQLALDTLRGTMQGLDGPLADLSVGQLAWMAQMGGNMPDGGGISRESAAYFEAQQQFADAQIAHMEASELHRRLTADIEAVETKLEQLESGIDAMIAEARQTKQQVRELSALLKEAEGNQAEADEAILAYFETAEPLVDAAAELDALPGQVTSALDALRSKEAELETAFKAIPDSPPFGEANFLDRRDYLARIAARQSEIAMIAKEAGSDYVVSFLGRIPDLGNRLNEDIAELDGLERAILARDRVGLLRARVAPLIAEINAQPTDLGAIDDALLKVSDAELEAIEAKLPDTASDSDLATAEIDLREVISGKRAKAEDRQLTEHRAAEIAAKREAIDAFRKSAPHKYLATWKLIEIVREAQDKVEDATVTVAGVEASILAALAEQCKPTINVWLNQLGIAQKIFPKSSVKHGDYDIHVSFFPTLLGQNANRNISLRSGAQLQTAASATDVMDALFSRDGAEVRRLHATVEMGLSRNPKVYYGGDTALYWWDASANARNVKPDKRQDWIDDGQDACVDAMEAELKARILPRIEKLIKTYGLRGS